MQFSTILEKIQNDPSYKFVSNALLKLEKALALYDITKKELWISFNGGKDATVILHLFRFALYKKYGTIGSEITSENSLKLANVVYFEETNPFEEVDKFVLDQAALYNFELVKMGKDLKKETEILVKFHGMKAVILGERDTDPFSWNREAFSPSDTEKGWEPFMRVNPILDWNYDQVWKFLLDFELPYCSLYNEGYTHLGNRNNTVKNPFLLENGGYTPAYLAQGVHENYCRKSYKEPLDYLSKSLIIGIYENTSEIEIINKKVKPFLGKTVKAVNFFEKNALADSEDVIRFLITKYGEALICYNKNLSKSIKFLSLEGNDKIKFMEMDF